MKTRSLQFVTVVCILSIVAMITALFLSKKPVLAEFTPPPFDVSAQTGTPEVPKELGHEEIDAMTFHVAVCGVVVSRNGVADVWLTNPIKNIVWLKLRILDTEGTVLGETGLAKPGEYIRSVALNKDVPTGTKLVLKLMAYEPNTYHSAGAILLNTVMQ